MDLSLIPIQSNISPAIKALYENSFLVHERRAWEQQLKLIQQRKLHLSEIRQDNVFTGFVFYWQLTGFTFIEHFAIADSARGKGTGTKIMQLLADTFHNIVLEVEPPETNTNAARRIKFYENLGYTSFKQAYLQPPYINGGNYHTMQLMFLGLDDKTKVFEKIRREIYASVYGISFEE